MAGRKVDGGALRKARRTAGLTLREVAALVGVASGARVGAWERGLEQPNARFIPLLAKAVNLPTKALLVGEGRNPGLIDLRLARGLSGVELAEAMTLALAACLRGVSAAAPLGRSAPPAGAGERTESAPAHRDVRLIR